MAILGPLAENVRIQFTISLTVPANYVSGDGNLVITDTLPAGLALYTSTGTMNGVTKNGADLTTGVAFAGTTAPTVTIDAAQITAGDAIVAIFDTYIATPASITADTPTTNSSAVAFSTADPAKYSSTGGTAAFTVTNLATDSSLTADPASVTRTNGTAVTLSVTFQASANQGTGDPYNYFVDLGLGDYLAYTTGVTAFYGDTAGAENTEFTADVDDTAAPTFKFGNIVGSDVNLASKFIKLVIPVTTQALDGTVITEIPGTYDVSIGGAVGVPKTFTIGITAATEIPVTKAVATK